MGFLEIKTSLIKGTECLQEMRRQIEEKLSVERYRLEWGVNRDLCYRQRGRRLGDEGKV